MGMYVTTPYHACPSNCFPPQSKGDSAHADQHLKRALAIDPTFKWALLSLGVAAEKEGSLDEAMEM